MHPHPSVPARRRAVFSPARFRAWRHVRAITPTALADAAAVPVAHVHACEQGSADPDPTTLIAWARLLGCRPSQLRSPYPHDPAEYWHAASQAMPPMTTDELAAVAHILLRHRTTRHRHPPRQ